MSYLPRFADKVLNAALKGVGAGDVLIAEKV